MPYYNVYYWDLEWRSQAGFDTKSKAVEFAQDFTDLHGVKTQVVENSGTTLTAVYTCESDPARHLARLNKIQGGWVCKCGCGHSFLAGKLYPMDLSILRGLILSTPDVVEPEPEPDGEEDDDGDDDSDDDSDDDIPELVP